MNGASVCSSSSRVKKTCLLGSVTSQRRYERGKSRREKEGERSKKSKGKRKCQSKQGKWDKGKMEREAEKGDRCWWKWVIRRGGNTCTCMFMQICHLIFCSRYTVARPVHPLDCFLPVHLSVIFRSVNQYRSFTNAIHLPPTFPCSSSLFVSPLPFIIALKQSSLTVVFVNGTVKKKYVAEGGFTARLRAD